MSGLDNRIALLHTRADDRVKTATQLEALKVELNLCLCDIQVQTRENLFLYLTEVSDAIERASAWDRSLEQSMLVESAGGLSDTNVDEKIRSYHSQAEEVVAKCMSDGSDDSKSRATALLAKIEQDISVYTIRKRADIVSKLTVVRDYMVASRGAFASSSSRSSQFPDPAAAVDKFDADMFSLVDIVGKLLNGDAGAGPGATPTELLDRGREVRKTIDHLSKDIRNFKLELDSRKQDESRFVFLDRATDLQENLADLEFNFRSRFEDEGAELLQAAMKNLTVSNARKEHTRASEDLFQL